MKISNGLLMRAYSAALWLYPEAFRVRYGAEMREAVARLHAESTDDARFLGGLALDTVRSIGRENLRAAGAPTPRFGVAFAVFFSLVLVAVSVGHQQWLRRGADLGPKEIVARMAGADTLVHYTRTERQPDGTLATTVDKMLRPRDLQPPMGLNGRVEIASGQWLRSRAPFAVLYDAAGHALEGNATLHGALPQPPAGIFDVIRTRGLDKVTWQPEPRVRVALVGEKMPSGGFVLAGESLLTTETQTQRFDRWLLWMWGVMVAAVCVVVGRGMVRGQRSFGG